MDKASLTDSLLFVQWDLDLLVHVRDGRVSLAPGRPRQAY